jgi:hypothetical protein
MNRRHCGILLNAIHAAAVGLLGDLLLKPASHSREFFLRLCPLVPKLDFVGCQLKTGR